jgi:hypothetical protein
MPETHFYTVKAGYALHVPNVQRESAKLWAKAGWGVDLSDPELRAFVEGQWHKLKKVESLSACSSIAQTPRVLLSRIEAAQRAAAGKPAPTKVEADVKASGIDLDTLPGIKAKPKRKASPKPTTEEEH